MSRPQREEAEDEIPAVAPPPIAYVVTFAVYLVLGYAFRSVVLNWIVGPLFLLGCLHVGPRLLGRRASGPAR